MEPYGLVLKAGRWYLVVGGPFGIRTYRVDQILALCPPAEFAVPEGFDLAAYGKDHVTGFRNRLHTGEALVRLTPEGGRRPGVTPPGDG